MKKQSRGSRRETKSAAELLWFSDRRKEAQALDPSVYWFEVDPDAAREAWNRVRETVLTKWRDEHPGTRPAAWWKFDAQGTRERSPKPQWGVLVPEYCFGLAVIGEDATYESQAEFLRRHGLLEKGEAARSDFTPEIVSSNDLLRYLATVDGIVE